MRSVLIAVIAASLFAPVLPAQESTSQLLKKACGPFDVKYSVHLDKERTPLNELPPTASRIIVYSETSVRASGGCRFYTVRVGMDGRWVGATCRGGYLAADITPGSHHLCVDLQWGSHTDLNALYSFDAEAGHTYYFRTHTLDVPSGIHLDPLNEEEGLLLVSRSAPSRSEVRR